MRIDEHQGNFYGTSIYARACGALGASLEWSHPGVERDRAGYVLDLEQNLLPGITLREVAPEFWAGAGNELDRKMRAPWSSSALVVNSFAPWRRSPDRLRLAGMAGFSNLKFEAKCPNRVSSIPPHMDVLLERGDEIVGVESKCIEYLKAKDGMVVSPRYLRLADIGDFRSNSKWFKVLRRVSDFHHLDAYQLIKHYLGLAFTYKGNRLAMVYIYWEPRNAHADPVFAVHRDEVKLFANLVAGDQTCRFLPISYPEHWQELEALDTRPPWLSRHINQLRERYLVEI